MAPEPSWQLSNAETGAGAPFSDQESIEGLLRRLIQRVEESERRYDEALGELHARLDRLSQSPEGGAAGVSPEEAETLERLREQLSGLARRQQPAPEPVTDHFAALDKALAEFRAVAAGLAAAEPGVVSQQPRAASEPLEASPASDFPFSMPVPEPDLSVPSAPPSFAGEEDLDQRLIDMAQRLEHSIGGPAPTAAIETLNARMDELAATFEAALQQSPKLESLHRLERQIGDLTQQLGRAEQHIARIGVVDSQLQWLVERVRQAPAEMEGLASKAAADAARLVAEAHGKPSAAERLEVLHRDLVAMNERGRVIDDRMVDTLEAMHASLQGLAEQLERPEAPASPAQTPFHAPTQPGVPDGMAPAGGDTTSSEDGHLNSLRDRLAASDHGFDSGRADAPFGRAKRSNFGEAAVDFDEMDAARLGMTTAEMSFDSMEDLVAAARRAAQAAAARAEERSARRPRREEAAYSASRGGEPERRTRSFLMVIAALLLIISAALLYSRLLSKPDFGAPPPVGEQSALPPGIGIAPAPSPSP